MEEWNLDFEWLRVRHTVQASLRRDKLPDMNAILFMIGMQELGYLKEIYTKEEKQDLMHVATCRLLSYDGYYEFEGRDADGWPHYKTLKAVPLEGAKAQGQLLQEKIVQYFNENVY